MTEKRLVWDLPLRAFHWLLVVSIGILYLTSELGTDYTEIHMYAGYFTIGLIVFRLLWGFAGTQHSRFVSFLPTPSKIKNYIQTNEKYESVGHNPLGSLMVFLMLFLILLQAVSGLFISDDILYAGPYNGAYSEEFEKLMTSIHHSLFDYIMVAIGIHVAAVLFYQFIKKQNLIKPMITGKKDALQVPENKSISGSNLITALVLIMVVAFFVYWLVVINAPVIEEEFYF